MDFNTNPSGVMHVDINSCFASIEQQANPTLRYKPVAVAAYNSPSGCILAPSIEAKTFGIKTGMRVKDAKLLYPRLIVLTPDPDKYRFIHLKLRKVLKNYCNEAIPKSIDEFVMDFKNYLNFESDLFKVAKNIKKDITSQVGDYIKVSIGIGPNRFLAKMAAGYKKPDGLTEINSNNYLSFYSKLTLVDLHGINFRNEARLVNAGINSVLEFFNSPLWKIKIAFPSINAYYWYLRLRGWEIDNVEFARKSYGNSFALPFSNGTREELLPILSKLCEKTGSRMRAASYKAKGVHLAISFKEHSYWHQGSTLQRYIFDSQDIYKEAIRLLNNCSLLGNKVHIIAVSCFSLTKENFFQPNLFEDIERKQRLVTAIDRINEKLGDFIVTSARAGMLNKFASYDVKDRIAFGGVKEL